MSSFPRLMAHAVLRAEPDESRRKPTWLSRLLNEMYHLAGMLAYLWIFFGVLVLSQYLTLTEHHIDYRFSGAALVNALLIVKVLLLADDFGFARRFNKRPLALAVLYRALAFAVLLMAFYLIEAIAIGAWRGRAAAASVPHFATSAGGLLAVTTMMFVGLIPFFSYTELGRVIGVKALHQILFRQGLRGPIPARDAVPESG